MRLAAVFQDHAVLQRDVPIAVWGEATPGDRVVVTLGPSAAAGAAGTDGRWMVRLPAQSAGGPFELTAATEGQPAIVLRDILVGEVWICSGQSNMEWRLRQVDQDGSQADGANLPRVRLLTVNTPSSVAAQTEVGGKWTVCTPEAISGFSAVGGWFGRVIHEALDVPVGLICNAWGGTRIEAWLSREALMTDPGGREELAGYEARAFSAEPAVPTFANVDEWFQAHGPEKADAHGRHAGWHEPGLDDAAWGTMSLPVRWQQAGHDHSGVFWFRRRVEVPVAWRGRDLALCLGAIDKHDETFVNGECVGGLGWERSDAWSTPREYIVPATLCGDSLVIAVRVRSHIYHGGMWGPQVAMKLHPVGDATESLSLAGPWRYEVEQSWGELNPPLLDSRAPGGQNAPYALFHSRLFPLIPYTIRGFAWYQGESNAAEPERYRRLLPLMVADWRRVWGQGDVPFLQVQLANYMAVQDEPGESSWAQLRAAQAAALAVPHVGLATAIDVGEADDIHPKDKRTVGERLARWALSRVYGRSVVPSGPILRAVRPVAGGRLRLTFEHAAGLATKDGGPVRQIAIAEADRKFVWAQARIDGEEIEVWSESVAHPAAARYAWADNPEGCNLVNGAGLPALPFDTDEILR